VKCLLITEGWIWGCLGDLKPFQKISNKSLEAAVLVQLHLFKHMNKEKMETAWE